MPELIDAFGDYGDFNKTTYFVICFNKLPSELTFRAPLERTKESMESVLASFDFDKFKLQEIFKDWSTDDDKDADSSDDYPYQYLFKSESKNLLIWISSRHYELSIDFLYDSADLGLEQDVISMNQIIRKQFGSSESPTFKVLKFKSDEFTTEKVEFDYKKINIADLYNDDFREVNTIIENALKQGKSGLILLHGVPGTGKTSYIKNLIYWFDDHSFIFIQNEFVKDLLRPDFVSFLINNRKAVLIIEDAEKVITNRESLSENSVVSTILQLTDGLFSDYLNIKIICSFNTNIDKVDKALMRKGRLIASYEFKPLSVEKSNKLLVARGYTESNTEMTLADIFNFEEKSFDTTGNKKKIGFN